MTTPRQRYAIDLVSFILNLGLSGYHLFHFVQLNLGNNINDKEYRGRFYTASVIAAAGPFALWPLTWLAYVIFYLIKVDEFTFSYISVKLSLIWIYGVSVGFWGFETIFNIYDWWQVLDTLAEKIPYRRPTEEEVAASD